MAWRDVLEHREEVLAETAIRQPHEDDPLDWQRVHSLMREMGYMPITENTSLEEAKEIIGVYYSKLLQIEITYDEVVRRLLFRPPEPKGFTGLLTKRKKVNAVARACTLSIDQNDQFVVK